MSYVWAVVIPLAAFLMQTLLCRARQRHIRLLGAYIVAFLFAFTLLSFTGIFSEGALGLFAGVELLGIICVIISGLFAIGVALAWIVYLLMLLAQKKHRKNSQK